MIDPEDVKLVKGRASDFRLTKNFTNDLDLEFICMVSSADSGDIQAVKGNVDAGIKELAARAGANYIFELEYVFHFDNNNAVMNIICYGDAYLIKPRRDNQ